MSNARPSRQRSSALERLAALEAAALRRRRSTRPPWPPASAPAPSCRCQHRLRARSRRLHAEAAAVAIDIEHPRAAAPAPPRIARLSRWSKNQPVFCPPERSARKRPPFSAISIGSLDARPWPSAHSAPALRASACRRCCAAAPPPAAAPGPAPPAAPAATVPCRRVFTCTTSASPKRSIDHARQAVRLGMDQPVVRRVEQASAAGPAPAAAASARNARSTVGLRHRATSRRAAISVRGLNIAVPSARPSLATSRTVAPGGSAFAAASMAISLE